MKALTCYGPPVGFFTKKGKVHPVFGPHVRTVKIPERAKIQRAPKTRLSHVERSMRVREGLKRKALPGEPGKNLRVKVALEHRFPGRGEEILEAAQSAYHYRNQHARTNPEPYELSQGGYIDEGLESLGLPHVATPGS